MLNFLTPSLHFDKNSSKGVETHFLKCYNLATQGKCDKSITKQESKETACSESKGGHPFEKADKKIWARMDAILCIHLYPLVYKTSGEHKQTLPRHAHGTR